MLDIYIYKPLVFLHIQNLVPSNNEDYDTSDEFGYGAWVDL